MKQFGKDFLCKLAVISVLIGIPMYLVIQSNKDRIDQINTQNSITASQNAQKLRDYQSSIDRFESSIDSQIKQIKRDSALWEAALNNNDPTVSMSEQDTARLGMMDQLPTQSTYMADTENQGAYSLLSEQSACMDMITQFLSDTRNVPQGITVNTYRLDMCNGS